MVEDERLWGYINSPEAASATDAIPHNENGWMRMVTSQRGSSPSAQRLVIVMAGQSWKDTDKGI